MQKDDELILIGVISAAHGLGGHVIIKSYTNPTENILKLNFFTKDRANIPGKKTRINSNGNIVYKPLSCSNRNDSEALIGTKLYCLRSDLPEANEEEFYFEDLKNLVVKNPQGEIIGKISNISNYGAGDILEVKFSDETDEMFPFTKEFFPEITNEFIILKK